MAERFELGLRIVVDQPVPGVRLLLQRGASGKAELVPPVSASEAETVFAFTVTVDGTIGDGRPRFLGPCVQGPPDGRFVYICVGQAAGQIDSAWSRRIKVPLGALTLDDVSGGGPLTARIAGKGKDGTPACATVSLLPPGWERGG